MVAICSAYGSSGNVSETMEFDRRTTKDIVSDLLSLNDDNLFARVFASADVQNCLLELSDMLDAEEQGLLIRLPCAVGSTVYVVEKCENVRMKRDDDYFTGTGAIECPFENSCDFEDCKDDNVRIFETTVNDFWYGDENANHPEIFLHGMGHGYMKSDLGKTVFLTEAEAQSHITTKPL